MSNKTQRPLLTIRQAAKLTGADYSTVRYWLEQGLLPSLPTPRGWLLIPRAAVERLIEAKTFAGEKKSPNAA
jgi:excisionase family DNA binding protein